MKTLGYRSSFDGKELDPPYGLEPVFSPCVEIEEATALTEASGLNGFVTGGEHRSGRLLKVINLPSYMEQAAHRFRVENVGIGAAPLDYLDHLDIQTLSETENEVLPKSHRDAVISLLVNRGIVEPLECADAERMHIALGVSDFRKKIPELKWYLPDNFRKFSHDRSNRMRSLPASGGASARRNNGISLIHPAHPARFIPARAGRCVAGEKPFDGRPFLHVR